MLTNGHAMFFFRRQITTAYDCLLRNYKYHGAVSQAFLLRDMREIDEIQGRYILLVTLLGCPWYLVQTRIDCGQWKF